MITLWKQRGTCSVPKLPELTPLPRRLRAPRRAGPDVGLAQAERSELLGPQRRLFGQEELVELRRLHGRAGEHRMGLTAVVDLVLEQVGEHAHERLTLHVVGALDRHGRREIGEAAAERDEPPIDVALRRRERGAGGERYERLEEACGFEVHRPAGDGAAPAQTRISTRTVTARDALDLTLAPSGGAAIRIAPAAAQP